MSLEQPEVVGGAGQVGVVDRRVEAAGDLGVEVVGDAVEELVDAVVVGLAARAVGLHEADAGEDERQVALDVGVDARARDCRCADTAWSAAAWNAIAHAGGTSVGGPRARRRRRRSTSRAKTASSWLTNGVSAKNVGSSIVRRYSSVVRR